MPGYNQRGPENMGPMTGRGMGRCTSGTLQAPNWPGRAYGPGRGRRCGRGFGFGRGSAPWPGTQFSASKEDLTLRARTLERELDAVKQELQNLSDE